MSNIPFIFVHIGDDFFPEYVNIAIKQCRKWNKENPIYVVCSLQHKDKITEEVHFVDIHSLNKSKSHNEFDCNNTFDINFRDGFYKYTTERFFILYEFCRDYNINEFFHLENDNMVYFSSDELAPIFRSTVNGMSCPALCMEQNVFGLMYCNNIEVLRSLCEFIKFNPNNISEMELGSKFFNENRDKTKFLPSIPNIYEKLSDTEEYYVSNNITIYKGIFDPAQYGQWLGGIDPRNQDAESKPFTFSNRHSLIGVEQFKYELRDESTNRKRYYLVHEDEKIRLPILLLHIHCKRLEDFYF